MDAKRDCRKKRKRHICPNCGNLVFSVLVGNFLFCEKCHAKTGAVVVNDMDIPVKSVKL